MTTDILIALIYCLVIPLAGLVLARKASHGLEAYFLGNRQFGALLMGVSGMTDWFDLSGTMLITSLLFLMGPRGLYVEFRGGAVLILAFLMLWTGKWHRRSGCMTAAEWISFRFGEGRPANALRTAIAAFNVIVAVGMLAYIVRGATLFFGPIFPWPPLRVTALVMGATVIYTAGAGFYGVTLTNILHGTVILLACLLVGAAGWSAVGEAGFDGSLATGITGVQDWMSALPSLQMYGLPSGYENREFLAGFTALCLVRVILGGMGTGNESRYFAARDDRACGLQSLIQGVMIAFRWPMMMGFAILGIVWLQASPGTVSASTTASVFAEQVIPVVLQHSLSPVARGIVLAALLGAMMSTLACGLNSAAATCVRDLYQHRLRPHAGGRELMIASYLSSLLLAALGFWAGVGAPDLNRLWGWLVMGLMTGSCGPMFLRLYWWRCNASGSVIGIICGISGTFIYHALGPSWGDTWPFIITAGCSFAGTIIGSLLTAPVPGSVLKNFFLVTRPFGVWGGYKQLLREADRLEHRRDLCALPFVMLAQICLFLSAMQLVLRDLSSAAISIVICLAAALCVWRIWGRYLYKSG